LGKRTKDMINVPAKTFETIAKIFGEKDVMNFKIYSEVYFSRRE
jgi:hypothetical protein